MQYAVCLSVAHLLNSSAENLQTKVCLGEVCRYKRQLVFSPGNPRRESGIIPERFWLMDEPPITPHGKRDVVALEARSKQAADLAC
jgi:hypothetical protein